MGFDRNLQPAAQPRWTLEMEREREIERERELELERRREQDELATPPRDDLAPDDPEATTDPAMPSGTTPLERDQRPINQSR